MCFMRNGWTNKFVYNDIRASTPVGTKHCDDFTYQEKQGIIIIAMRYMTPLHAGGRLNKKDGLTRHGNSHVKDKTS